jgi:peptidoglycan hydrolase CwlO-like protein
MKLYHLIAAVVILSAAGCNNRSEQLEQQNAELQSKYSQIAQDLSTRDAYIDSITQSINDIYNNLESVRTREGLVLKHTGEMETKKKLTNQEVRQKLLDEVSLIDSSLKDNRHRINDLQSKLNGARSEYAGLKKMVASLKKTIEEREATIAQLDQKIEGLMTEVNTKTQLITQRDSVIEQQHNEINRAFYIVGTRRELEEKGIIAKQGGFLWGLLGSTTVLASGMDSKYFSPIDKFQNTSLDIGGAISEMVPKRDAKYYTATEVAKNQTKLDIAEPQNFWQDKYLVIITD